MTEKPEGTSRHALLDRVPEMVTVSDRRGRIVYANPATERVSGFAPEEFVRLDPFSRMHPEDRPRCERAFERLLNTQGLDLELEHRVRHKDGSWRWVEVTLASLFEDPDVGGLLATVKDVTARKRAEEALRESERKYSAAFDSMDEGFCMIELVYDGDGEIADLIFRETNKAFEKNTGLSDVVGKTVGELLPAFESYWIETYSRVARTCEAVRAENYVRDVDRWYGVHFSLVGEVGSRYVAVLFDDITERKRSEEERQRLRALEASALAEAAERERINRELHDRVAHTMGVAHQSLELHSALADSAPERADEKLRLAREVTRTALDQTRNLSAQLARRGKEETRDGLTFALRELLETHLPDGVGADLSAKGDETAVPPPVREQAYLVMREAVRNAVAHSGCRRIGVSVELGGGELKGLVEDDGEGFVPGAGSDDGKDGGPAAGVGLRSMRERTEMIGGRLEISSHPGRGTAVEVRVPLAD
jgi:PAS domain S-box-containing protein